MKKKKQSSAHSRMALLYTSAALLLCVLVFSAFAGRNLDQSDCPTSGVGEHVAVLHDPTSKLNNASIQAIQGEILTRANAVEARGRFTLFAMSQGQAEALPAVELFSRCRPETEGNPLWSSPPLMARNFKTRYQDPLKEVVAGISEMKDADTSPILAALHSVVTKHRITHLVIISDALENSAALNFYESVPPFETQKSSLHVTGLTSRLHGVKVTVLQLTSAKIEPLQKRADRRFWSPLWKSASVSEVTTTTIEEAFNG